ncbi:MAG: hypothetical protein POELPBGB_03134 [Bacteroidia bacterium]|nr:hypothetical protein [Bacteroidia bacterium]
MINQFKEISSFSKKKFNVEGRRFYYSPQTTLISLIVNVGLLVLSIATLFFNYNWGTRLILIFCCAFPIYSIYNLIPKLIFVINKTPVFIINGKNLFYTKQEIWYDIENSDIFKKYAFRGNYYGTLVIKDKIKCIILEENFWYIEYDEDLKDILCKIKRNRDMFFGYSE